MSFIKILVLLLTIGIVGCSSAKTEQRGLLSSYALPGTSTAVVGIGVDKKGIPLETVKEIILKPGQKVIFAGPDKFIIEFKNKKTPSRMLRYESKSGVVSIEIPKNILSLPEFSEEFEKNNFLRFDYSIFVNGRELDPPMIIRRDG